MYIQTVVQMYILQWTAVNKNPAFTGLSYLKLIFYFFHFPFHGLYISQLFPGPLVKGKPGIQFYVFLFFADLS